MGIMTQPYGEGEEEERFTYSAFLVLNNRVVACCVAIAILFSKGESMVNVAPILNYFGICISNTAATVCQYEALRYVTFPTQTLGKCGKTIPVLILGTLIAGKKYGVVDYVVCAMVTLGCTVFVLTGDISGSSKSAEADSFYGLLLMAGYLSFDGFTSVFQEKLFKQYKISSYNQMLYVNTCSGIMSLLGLIVAGQLLPAIEFSMRHPGFLVNAFMLSLCASMGQWVGAAMVFGTLYWKATQKKPKAPPTPLPT